MPCEFFIDQQKRLVISIGWGCLTFAEMIAHGDSLLAHPDFNPEFDHLMDAREVTSLQASANEIKILVHQKMFSSKSRRAWVANNLSVYGIGRMAMAYQEASNARTDLNAFYDLPSALQWLGLESSVDIAVLRKKAQAVTAVRPTKISC